MRSTYSTLYVHLVWATWDRTPFIRPEYQEDIHRWIVDECRKHKTWVAAIGSVEDHIHLLVDLSPAISVADLMKRVKGNSSYLVNVTYPQAHFKWQGAYGAFAVSRREVSDVIAYVRSQKEHHARGTTCEEWESADDPPDGFLSIGQRDTIGGDLTPATKVTANEYLSAVADNPLARRRVGFH